MLDWGVQQHDRYQQQQGCRKGPWTSEEDKLLTEYVSAHGEGRWSTVAKCAGLNRSGKSCRLRWVNYLRPGLKRGQITPQEEGIILELHSLWGNKWSTIARYLPGRTDNEIKNYWRTHYKKKEKSFSKLGKAKMSELRKQQQDLMKEKAQQPQQNQQSQLLSQDLLNLDKEQSYIVSSLPYSGTFLNDQLHMPQNVGPTSSGHSMLDERNLWSNLWNLENDDSDGFGGIFEQRTSTNPSCASGNHCYNGVNTGGYIF